MSPWPAAPVAVGDIVTAAQLNLLPIQIADSTLTVSASSFDFTSLPSAFAHLLVIGYLRCDAVATSSILMRVNNDSATNYLWRALTGSSSAATSSGSSTTSMTLSGQLASAGETAGVFTPFNVWLPHYANAANQKSAMSLSFLGAATPVVQFSSGLWNGTAAVSRLTFLTAAGNFVAGSRMTIYGLA